MELRLDALVIEQILEAKVLQDRDLIGRGPGQSVLDEFGSLPEPTNLVSASPKQATARPSNSIVAP
jgi:hypothetical protein